MRAISPPIMTKLLLCHQNVGALDGELEIVEVVLGLALQEVLLPLVDVRLVDEERVGVEQAHILRLLHRVDLADERVVGEGRHVAALEIAIVHFGRYDVAVLDRLGHRRNAVGTGDSDLAVEPFCLERLHGRQRHVIIRRPDPVDVRVFREPGLRDAQRLLGIPVPDFGIEKLDAGIFLERLLEPLEPVDARVVAQRPLEREYLSLAGSLEDLNKAVAV